MNDLQPLISLSVSWIMLAFCIMGIVGNILSAYIFAHQSMRSAINLLLTGLSFIDLSMDVLVIPTFVVVGLSDFYVTLKDSVAYIMCFGYPLVLIMQSCSVWTFILITFERYIAVCHPLKAIRLCTIGNTRKSLFGVCIAAVFYNLPRFLEYNFSYDERGKFTYYESLRSSTCYNLIYYTVLYLITHFVVPFTFLSALNTLMVRRIYLARQERNRLCNRENREQNTSIMMAVIVGMFLICDSPIIVINIVTAVQPSFFQSDDTKWLAYMMNDLANLLIVINSSTNCFIYYAFSERYRRLTKKLLGVSEETTTNLGGRDSITSKTSEQPSVRTALVLR